MIQLQPQIFPSYKCIILFRNNNEVIGRRLVCGEWDL